METLGRHLIVELYDCYNDAISEVTHVKDAMIETAHKAKANIVDVSFHQFNPYGVSGVIVIAESHLSVHTWPEYGYAAVDIFTCNPSLEVYEAIQWLKVRFAAKRIEIYALDRGKKEKLSDLKMVS